MCLAAVLLLFLFFNARYISYLSFLRSDVVSFSDASKSAPALVHSVPFIFFSLWSSYLLPPCSLRPPMLFHSKATLLFLRAYFGSPFFLVGIVFIALGSFSGINPNLIGRTSIVYAVIVVLFLIALPRHLYQCYILNLFRKTLTLMIISIPLLYRAISSYSYAQSLV